MFKRKHLSCSFCGKTAAQVAKLVAGPKVYICDGCVAQASRIMVESGGGAAAPAPTRRGFWTRLMLRVARPFLRSERRESESFLPEW